jgi:hypothetical protein
MMKSIGRIMRQFRRWLHHGRETWLIVDQHRELFLECVVCADTGEIILQRWVRSPARAYTFTAYQREQIEHNGQMPEGSTWLHFVDLPLFRQERR